MDNKHYPRLLFHLDSSSPIKVNGKWTALCTLKYDGKCGKDLYRDMCNFVERRCVFSLSTYSLYIF